MTQDQIQDAMEKAFCRALRVESVPDGHPAAVTAWIAYRELITDCRGTIARLYAAGKRSGIAAAAVSVYLGMRALDVVRDHAA